MSLIVILSDGVTPEQRAATVRVLQHYGHCIPLSEMGYAVHTGLAPEHLLPHLIERAGVGEQQVQIFRVKGTERGASQNAPMWRPGASA